MEYFEENFEREVYQGKKEEIRDVLEERVKKAGGDSINDLKDFLQAGVPLVTALTLIALSLSPGKAEAEESTEDQEVETTEVEKVGVRPMKYVVASKLFPYISDLGATEKDLDLQVGMGVEYMFSFSEDPLERVHWTISKVDFSSETSDVEGLDRIEFGLGVASSISNAEEIEMEEFPTPGGFHLVVSTDFTFDPIFETYLNQDQTESRFIVSPRVDLDVYLGGLLDTRYNKQSVFSAGASVGIMVQLGDRIDTSFGIGGMISSEEDLCNVTVSGGLGVDF